MPPGPPGHGSGTFWDSTTKQWSKRATRRHLTAVAASEADRQKATVPGLLEGSDDILRFPICRVTHCDVGCLRKGGQLSRRGQLVGDAFADFAQQRLIGDEAPGRQ